MSAADVTMTITAQGAAAPRWATTTLAEHTAATRALTWLAETHPDLPTGMVELSVYRREGEPVDDGSRRLSVQVHSIDDVAAWARALAADGSKLVQVDEAQYISGRLRAFVDESVFGVPVHVYALVRVETVEL